MLEILNEAVSSANMIYTIFLGLSIIYWFLVMLGALDIDGLDFDFDVDLDADVDIDVDSDLDVSGGGNFLSGILIFFNFGKMPFMIIFSFISLTMWTIGMLSNHYLGGGNLLFAMALFVPILFVSAIIAKLITTPLIPVFREMGGDVENVDYLGRTAIVTLQSSKTKLGQIKLIENNDIHILNAKVHVDNKKDSVKKDDEVVVIDKAEDGNYYWIQNV